MKKNVGKTDGIIRLVLVAVLVLLYFILNLQGVAGYIALGLALVLCVTVLVGFCPLYYPFNISTRGKKK